jgi:copper homeostasis protein
MPRRAQSPADSSSPRETAGRKIHVEVSIDSLDSALTAQSAGADRVELCGNLLEGGTTPSAGLIVEVRRNVSLKLHVMIRPRGGDFCYSDGEFRIMERDIAAAKELGADAVVLGILDPDGAIDATRMAKLIEQARPLRVTCHRAIDMSRNLLQSLETLIGLGVDYVLTSGGEQTAIEGSAKIARLVRAAGDRIAVTAGSGIHERNVRRLIDETGLTEIHVGLSGAFPTPMKYRNTKICMGKVKGREFARFATSRARLEKLIAAASSA